MINQMKKYRINYFDSKIPLFQQFVSQGFIFPKELQPEFKKFEAELKSLDSQARSGLLNSTEFKIGKENIHKEIVNLLIKHENEMKLREINKKKIEKELKFVLLNIKSIYEIQPEIFSYQDEYSKQMERQGFPKIKDKSILSQLVELEKRVAVFYKVLQESSEENKDLMKDLYEETKSEVKEKIYQLCLEYLYSKEHAKQLGKEQMSDKLPGLEIANLKKSLGERVSTTKFIFPEIKKDCLGPVLSSLSDDYNVDVYGEKDLVYAEAVLSQLALAYIQYENGFISKNEINSLEKVVYEVLCRIVERNN